MNALVPPTTKVMSIGCRSLARLCWLGWKPLLLSLLLLAGSLPDAMAQTTCGQTVTFNYGTAATGSRKSYSEPVGGTTLTTGNYSSTVTGTNTNLFSVGADALLSAGNYLVWRQNNVGVNGANVATVTYTFSRPLTNFRMRITDIDQDLVNAYFIDRVTFDGYATTTAATPLTLVAADVTPGTNNTNRFVGSGSGLTAATSPQYKDNAVTGIAASNANRASDVIVRFPSPIQKLVLTYENLAPANTTIDRTQITGIVDMTWCAQADIQTTVTGPTSGSAGSTVAYIVTTQNLSGDAANGVVPTLTLVPNLPAASLTLPAGAAYDPNTGIVTFATINNLATGAANAVASTVSFVMPNQTVTGKASSTGLPDDPTVANNNGTATAANITTTVAPNRPPVAANVTNTPNLPNSSPATAIAPLSATDPDGNNSIASYTLLTIPNATTQGTLYVNGGQVRAGQLLTPAQIAQLSFAPVGTFVGNATFTYLVTDNQGATSNTATYTIPVVAGSADVVTTISGPTAASGGQTISYTAISTNNGPNYAQGVVATIQLPANTTGVQVTNGIYNPATGLVTFDAIGLASGATAFNTVSFMAPTPSGASATVTGKAANSSTTADPTAANNNGTATAANVTTTVTAVSIAGTPGPCATNYTPADNTSLTTIDNQYYAVADQTTSVGATSITLVSDKKYNSSAADINSGDLLLVIQMQGADIDGTNTTSYGNGVTGQPVNGNLNDTNFTAGRYEYVFASGTTKIPNGPNSTVGLTLASGLKNAYLNADATAATGQRRFQVIKVASYRTLTLGGNLSLATNGTPWNGRFGGVIALDVLGQLNFNGKSIDASGAGFRGGAGRELAGDATASGTDYRNVATKNVHGAKGEGTAGTPRYLNNGGTAATDNTLEGYLFGSQGRGAPGNAGGGGTDANAAANDQNSGGGGGANGGQGGRGGNSWSTNRAVGGEPGAAFPVASTSRLVMGGGGGAGTTNNGTGANNNGFASSGAAGGGLVLVRTGSVAGAGFISANGANADNSVLNDGSGGGGAGGSVLLTANNPAGLPNIILQANGGNGGSNTPGANAHGPGGGGGGGFVFANGAISSASSANGGSNGLTNSTNNAGAYGAEPGQSGVVNAGISNTITNSTAGINCAVDLTSSVTGQTTAAPASTVSLNVDFSNNGGTAANSATAGSITRTVSLTGLTPGSTVSTPGATVASGIASGTGTYTVTYPALTTLAATTTNSYGISYVAPATGSVVATSTITTTGTPTDAVPGNNTSSLTTAVSTNADVTTTVNGPTTLYAGQPSGTYTATFTNNGPAPALAVSQKVTLPTGATNVLVNGTTYTPTTPNVIDFGTMTSLAAGATNTYTFSYTASATPTGPTPATAANTLSSNVTTTSLQGANTAPDAASLALTILGTADVQATIAAQSATVTAGGTGTNQGQFNVNFRNLGALAAAAPTLSVQLAPNLTNVTIGALTGYTASYNSATGLVTYTPTAATPTIGAGANVGTSAIKFDVPATGPITATAIIGTTTTEGGQTANNTATAVISVTPKFDLQTSISTPAASVPVDGVVTYNVTTLNATAAQTAGSISPATNVVQTVQLPANLTNVYVSNGGVYNKNDGLVTFPTLPSLAPGASFNNVISYSPTATMAATTITATATPSTTLAGDLNTANNTASVTTTVTAATTSVANLYTQITASAPNVAPGAPVTFTVSSGNSGPAAVTALTQTVSLPAGLTGVTITGGPAGFTASNANYNAVTGLVTFPTITGPVASATAYTYTITVNAPASGFIAALSTIGSAVSDPMPGNNVSTTDVTVNPTANDVATAISGPATVLAGQAVTYTVTTTNNGPTPANPTQTVYIPAGLTAAQVTFGGPNATGATYDATTGLVTFATALNLAAGAQLENTVTYLAPAVSTLTTVATVAGSSADNVPGNNTATTTTTVLPTSDFTVAINGPTAATATNPLATTVAAGNLVTYVVTTTNNGPSAQNGQTTTVKLPAGLTALTAVSVSGGGTYDNATGVVTFPAQTNQAPGAANAIVNTITFIAPYAPAIVASATVTPTADSNEQLVSNNTATTVTALGPQTAAVADVLTTIAANVTNQAAGSPVVFTVTTANASTTVTPALVAQKVVLPAGLTGVTISGPNGATTANYDATTGVVTLPVLSTMPVGTTYSYSITVNAPGKGPLTATALVTDNTADPNLTNNVASTSVSIAPRVDEQVSLVGPTQVQPNTPVTYTVTARNNGPSTATNVIYSVQLPAGLGTVAVSGDGVYNNATGVVTFGTLSTQEPGASGQVMNTITFTSPTYSYSATAQVAANGDVNQSNNTSVVTTQVNYLPVALPVVNSVKAPEGNTAGQLDLSPLLGTDTDPGTVVSFLITSLPTAAPNGNNPGVLNYNGTPATVGTLVTDVTKLTFGPATNFVGNAFFTYAAIDNQGGQSLPALYTIPVGQDRNSVYTTIVKGGNANVYNNGDVVAYGIDVNGAAYNASGLVYNANGTLATGTVNNGIQTGSITTANTTALAAVGIAYNATTGLFTVTDRTKLPRAGTTIPVTITTTDLYGGTNTQTFNLVLGVNPLPVELTDFTATAVKNVDAVLVWHTASEKNNDHFDVERSLTGTEFTKIGQVKGQGSSSAATAYTLTDAGIGPKAAGLVYYRLKQVDADGTSSYSPVRTVAFTAQAPAISLFPNPATAGTQLDLRLLPAGTYQVRVLDATGRMVLGTMLDAGLAHALDLNTIASGTYMVLVTGQASGQPLKLTTRLIKE